jgi:hypothetical protein
MNQPDMFTEAEHEWLEERAGMRQEAGESKAEAEKKAREDVERHKFQCMCRQLIRWIKGGEKHKAVEWLDGVKERGVDSQIYEDAAIAQMKLGNIGVHPDWRGE